MARQTSWLRHWYATDPAVRHYAVLGFGHVRRNGKWKTDAYIVLVAVKNIYGVSEIHDVLDNAADEAAGRMANQGIELPDGDFDEVCQAIMEAQLDQCLKKRVEVDEHVRYNEGIHEE